MPAFSNAMVSAQRSVVVALVVAIPLAIHRGVTNSFQLPKFTLLVLGALVLAALSVARLVIEGSEAAPRSRLLVPVLAFCAAAVVATLAAPSPVRSLVGPSTHHVGAATYLAFAVVAVTVVAICDVTNAWRIVYATLLAGCLASVYGLLQSVGRDPLKWEAPTTPVFATFGNANFLSGYLGIVAAVAFAASLATSRVRSVRLGSACVGLLAAVVAVRTRSFQGVAAAGVGASIAGVWMRRSIATSVRWPTGANRRVVLIVCAAVVVGLTVLSPRLASYGQSAVAKGFRERQEYWYAARGIVRDHPIVGIGMDSFADHYYAYRSATASSFEIAEDPHSVPIAMFTDGGVVLGVAYIAFVSATGLVLVRSIRRGNPEQRDVLVVTGAGWAAYQAQSIVGIETTAVGLTHWVFTGAILGIALARVAPNFVRRPKPAGDSPRARPAQRPRPTRASRRARLSPVQLFGVAATGLVTVALVSTALRPLRADSAATVAEALVRAKRADLAIDATGQATRLAPWEPRYWFLRAAALESTDDLPGARRAAARAAATAPGSPLFAELSAKLAIKARDFDSAAKWYAEALRRDPNSVRLLDLVARYHLSRTDTVQAIALAERGIRLDPNVAALWVDLGHGKAALGDHAGAERAYRRVLELEPTNADARGFFISRH